MMRKLLILKYPNIKNLNLEDEAEFRNLILWLEEQKIRHYEIVDRAGLRDVKAQNWTQHFKAYLKDLEYPYKDQNRMIIVDWLAGIAVKLEFFDDGEKFRKCCASDVVKRRQNDESASTLKMLSAKDERLKKYIKEFAELLQIPPHYLNDEITLEAVKIFVQQRIESNLKKSSGDNNEKQMKLSVSDSRLQLGFTTKDTCLDNMARALRFLHINELRQLQTQINAAIVSVQAITANPKTDQKLGKIGRS